MVDVVFVGCCFISRCLFRVLFDADVAKRRCSLWLVVVAGCPCSSLRFGLCVVVRCCRCSLLVGGCWLFVDVCLLLFVDYCLMLLLAVVS